MLTHYLKKAPTLIVVAVTGFVAWPILFPEGGQAPSKSTSKPPAASRPPKSPVETSIRDPFRADRTPRPTVLATTSAAPASPVPGSKSDDPPGQPSDEDKVLDGMRLGGTFIDGREQLAVIDRKVYARGDQLRGADGSTMPYVIAEVRKDRAVLRRGRREFVLGFSNVPGRATPKSEAPGVPAPSRAGTSAGSAASADAPAAGGKPPATGRPPGGTGDPTGLILQLLTGLGGPSGRGLDPVAPGIEVARSTIVAGLDALMGQIDNIGRGWGTP